METKSLVQTAVAVLVAVVVFAAVLVPVVSNAQMTAGPTVTFENTSPYTYTLSDTGDLTGQLVCTPDAGITWNDEPITEDGFVIYSDTLTVRVRLADGVAAAIYTRFGEDTDHEQRPSWVPVTITFTPGNAHIERGDEITDVAYSWIFSPSEDGKWVTTTPTYGAYANTINDVVASGYYSTGDLDCQYSVKDGAVTCTNGYTGRIVWNPSKIDGTTDAYRVTEQAFQIEITDGDTTESFRPWYYLAMKEITGHEESPTVSNLLGIIPILVIVGLILGVVGFAIARRYDL